MTVPTDVAAPATGPSRARRTRHRRQGRGRPRAVAVVISVLTLLGVTSVGPAHAATVSFTATVAGDTVSVRATTAGLVNPSFCWYFGDEVRNGDFGAAILCRGASAFGPNATHTYAQSGTYTVTVVVDDDLGIGGGSSQQVSVTGAASNQPPTASFTATTSGLTVSVDGSASRDPDGTIARWCWDFGAGAAVTCTTTPTATYTFPAPGTYTVSLAAIDVPGTGGYATRTVTVAAPAPTAVVVARDAFGRTLTSGWGTADTGGPWSVSGTGSRYTVSGGVGSHRVPTAGTTLTSLLNGVSGTRTDAAVTLSTASVPTGGGTYVSLLARRVGSADYSGRLRFYPDRTVRVQVARTGTVLKEAVLGGLSYAPGTALRLRVQVTGTSPTTLRAKAWKVGTTEPSAWQLSTTDATAGLQTTGVLGLSSYLSSSATLAPVTVRFDDLAVTRLP